MRPAATDGVLKPSPSPLAFQASVGPPAGQALSKPVSSETAVRCGPCHCGQSNDCGLDSFSMGGSLDGTGAEQAGNKARRQQTQRADIGCSPEMYDECGGKVNVFEEGAHAKEDLSPLSSAGARR